MEDKNQYKVDEKFFREYNRKLNILCSYSKQQYFQFATNLLLKHKFNVNNYIESIEVKNFEEESIFSPTGTFKCNGIVNYSLNLTNPGLEDKADLIYLEIDTEGLIIYKVNNDNEPVELFKLGFPQFELLIHSFFNKE